MRTFNEAFRKGMYTAELLICLSVAITTKPATWTHVFSMSIICFIYCVTRSKSNWHVCIVTDMLEKTFMGTTSPEIDNMRARSRRAILKKANLDLPGLWLCCTTLSISVESRAPFVFIFPDVFNTPKANARFGEDTVGFVCVTWSFSEQLNLSNCP